MFAIISHQTPWWHAAGMLFVQSPAQDAAIVAEATDRLGARLSSLFASLFGLPHRTCRMRARWPGRAFGDIPAARYARRGRAGWDNNAPSDKHLFDARACVNQSVGRVALSIARLVILPGLLSYTRQQAKEAHLHVLHGFYGSLSNVGKAEGDAEKWIGGEQAVSIR